MVEARNRQPRDTATFGSGVDLWRRDVTMITYVSPSKYIDHN